MAVIAVVALLVTGAWWMMGAPAMDFPDTVPPRALDALATRAFAIVAGLGAAALLVIHYRRQRTTEADTERETAKLFTETFDSAGNKLGSEHAAVRLAGVHALVRLADEAPQGRADLVQMIIDVLCAYLRMPYTPAPEKPSKLANKEMIDDHRDQELEYASFREVRHTIIRVIGDRLRWPTRWRGKYYDFTGVVFDGGSFSGAVFESGGVSFHKAKFISGEVDFNDTKFTGGTTSFHGAEFIGGEVNFVNAKFIKGKISFLGARFGGSKVNFLDARFAGGEVEFFNAKFTGGEVSFYRSEFHGGEISFYKSSLTGGRLTFGSAKFIGGVTSFLGAELSDGKIDFLGAEFSGAEVSFLGAKFSGSTASFFGATFTGGWIEFRKAEFTAGEINFVATRFIGGKVNFLGASGNPPVDLLASFEKANPEVIALPAAWEYKFNERE
ncbi:pentapeptide repeat-containing protein [Nocardiopsis flavescens]|uniref:pentapeptide repeat-containing protein n=1 Tax=Nocardiopsis flavescens TaxID=758803 RepID=UPI00364D6199